MKLHATIANESSQKTRSSNDFIRVQVRDESRKIVLDFLIKADGTITGHIKDKPAVKVETTKTFTQGKDWHN